MQVTKSTSRITWIDMAKGYGAILVIYAHLGVGDLWTWMYSFHLPLFFFLSGYVFHAKDNFIKFTCKKIKSIVVPYFCLGIPMVLFQLLTYYKKGVFSMDVAASLFERLLQQKRFWTLWFMACLFCLNLAFYLLVKLCRKEWIIMAVSDVLPLLGLVYYERGGLALYWNADACLMAVPFFALGYLYKLHTKQIDEVVDQLRFNIPMFVVLAIVNVIAWRKSLDETGLGLEMFQSNYGNPVYTYIAAFAGIFCVVIVSKWFTIQLLRYVGENSMLYYAWHQTIVIPLMNKVFAVLGWNVLQSYGAVGVISYKWLMVLAIVAVLSVCNWCISKMGWKFIVGK